MPVAIRHQSAKLKLRPLGFYFLFCRYWESRMAIDEVEVYLTRDGLFCIYWGHIALQVDPIAPAREQWQHADAPLRERLLTRRVRDHE
jgi:hypothetical protein